MRLFNPDNRTRSAEHKRVYALYELAYTLNDFGAALLFVIGSIMFFSEHGPISVHGCSSLGRSCSASARRSNWRVSLNICEWVTMKTSPKTGEAGQL